MSKEKETGKEKGRIRQLARYYIPYKGLFFTDMFFAMLGAAITLDQKKNAVVTRPSIVRIKNTRI